MIPLHILLRNNLIYIILSYNVFQSVKYSDKTCDLQQSKPACLILWRMAPVIIMGRLSKCGRDPGHWKRCRNPAQTGHWQQIQEYGVESIRVSYCMHLPLCYTDWMFFVFLSLQLFLFLQDFSHRMLSKTHEIEKQLDGLIQDTKATDSRLHSVFNDFLMLSNTQFIENVCNLFIILAKWEYTLYVDAKQVKF